MFRYDFEQRSHNKLDVEQQDTHEETKIEAKGTLLVETKGDGQASLAQEDVNITLEMADGTSRAGAVARLVIDGSPITSTFPHPRGRATPSPWKEWSTSGATT